MNRGKRAVLVYPRFATETFWSFRRALERYVPRGRFGLPRRSLPPLGLMGLTGKLRERYDDVEIFDRNVDPRPFETVVADADHVYIGGMVAQQDGFIADARAAKKLGKTVIGGGTIVDERSVVVDLCDHLVENEAENVLDGLLDDLFLGRAKKYTHGTAAPGERFFRPDYSSIDVANYASMAVQISRGCPFDCEFCDITPRFGKSMRIAPAEHTADALRQLRDLGWTRSLFVVDDNFIGNPAKALAVLQQLCATERELGYHVAKYTEVSLNLADDTEAMAELRHWFREAHFTDLFIGVETPDEAALRETRKRQNLRGHEPIELKLERIARETGATPMIGMIHGFDADDASSVARTIHFVNRTPAPTVMQGLLMTLPTTKLWGRLAAEGRLVEESNGASGNNTDGTMNFIPYRMSVAQAERNYLEILRGIYAPAAFFKRVMAALSLVDPLRRKHIRSPEEARLALRRLPTGPHGLTYLRYLRQAFAIARRRFGFGTDGFAYVLSEYVRYCALYTHMRGMTDSLAADVAKRAHAPWQLYSWLELQGMPVEKLEVLEPAAAGAPSLYDRVCVRLRSGYEVLGTRLDVLSRFVEPHLKEALRSVRDRFPTVEQLREIEIKAYLAAHLRRPEILAGLDARELIRALESRVGGSLEHWNVIRDLLYLVRQETATDPA